MSVKKFPKRGFIIYKVILFLFFAVYSVYLEVWVITVLSSILLLRHIYILVLIKVNKLYVHIDDKKIIIKNLFGLKTFFLANYVDFKVIFRLWIPGIFIVGVNETTKKFEPIMSYLNPGMSPREILKILKSKKP